MSGPPTILVVDDDPHIREVVCFALAKGGYRTVEAGDGREALDRFAAAHPDLVVLDILMPELDGTEVCRRLRATSAVPIVFLTSRDDEVDRIVGLELGGDDYLTKPFSPRELVARVKAVLRRSLPGPAAAAAPRAGGKVLSHGRLRLDLDRFLAFWDEREVALTVTELGILRTLLGYPGKVYSRDQVMDGAYQDYAEIVDRTIDSHVRRIRRKFAALGADPIETVHGLGYRIAPCR
jgi:two-component system OmpR family response regulator